MHLAKLTKLLALLTAVAMASAGCARAHLQEPEQKIYIISEDTSGIGSALESGTGGAGAEAYCNELQKQCYQKCWRRKPTISSIPKHSEKHKAHCSEICLAEFMKCVKEQEDLERQESQSKALHFPTIEAAIAWIREHKAEVAVGTLVIVAGAVAAPYVVALMGGSLVLASF